MSELDGARLVFSPEALVGLNALLALIVFGIALDIRLADFQWVFKIQP